MILVQDRTTEGSCLIAMRNKTGFGHSKDGLVGNKGCTITGYLLLWVVTGEVGYLNDYLTMGY